MPFRDSWLLVGPLLALVGFAAAQPIISAVGFVIIIVGGLSRLWSRHLFDRFSLRRRLSERRAFIGEHVDLTVEMENDKPLPLPWYEWRLGVADSVHVDEERMASALVPGLSWLLRRGAIGWYERRTWTFRLTPSERGYHQVGPGAVRSADLLGVFPAAMEDDTQHHLLVFPRVFSMHDLGLPADRPFGDMKGRNRLYEDPLRIAGLREYRPGDSLRRIDWKATARTGDLQSRVYDPSATEQIYLVLNIDTMAHAWEGYLKDELERAISVTASIAVWAAGQRFSVGLLANGAYPDADRPIRLPPSRSRDQITRILEALAVVQPLTMGELAGTIRRESSRIPAGSTIVVIASLLPPALADVIARLAEGGHRVHVIATSDRVTPSQVPGIPFQHVGRAFARAEAVP